MSLYRWSGITAEKLAKATLSLCDVQAHFLKLLTPTTILLGHSLESDLNALKIRHPLCIDTALLYRHPRGQPYKPGLKWLVKQWLGREIQTAGAGGHDSEEDARACVDLLRMKLINGEFYIAYVFRVQILPRTDHLLRHCLSFCRPRVWRSRRRDGIHL